MNKRERERRSARRRLRECLRVMNVRKEKYIYIRVCVEKRKKSRAALSYLYRLAIYWSRGEKADSAFHV